MVLPIQKIACGGGLMSSIYLLYNWPCKRTDNDKPSIERKWEYPMRSIGHCCYVIASISCIISLYHAFQYLVHNPLPISCRAVHDYYLKLGDRAIKWVSGSVILTAAALVFNLIGNYTRLSGSNRN